MYDNAREGNLLMDAPVTSRWDELCKMAQNQISWGKRVRTMRSPRVSISIGPHFVPGIDYVFTIS